MKNISFKNTQIVPIGSAFQKRNTTLWAAPVSAARLLAVLATVVFLLFPSSALALGDNCKDVRISVFNDHPVEVKVTKIEYRDYDRDNKWRNESGVNRKIATTKHYQFLRNFEHVKNDDTKIRITYRENLGGSRWGGEQTVEGAKHQCTEGEYNRIHLPGPSVYDQP